MKWKVWCQRQEFPNLSTLWTGSWPEFSSVLLNEESALQELSDLSKLPHNGTETNWRSRLSVQWPSNRANVSQQPHNTAQVCQHPILPHSLMATQYTHTLVYKITWVSAKIFCLDENTALNINNKWQMTKARKTPPNQTGAGICLSCSVKTNKVGHCGSHS